MKSKKRKKTYAYLAIVVLLVSVVYGAGIWISRVEQPIDYDEEALIVDTEAASNVSNPSATLNGNLRHMRRIDEANVSFRWREYDFGEEDPEDWNETDSQKIQFDETRRFNTTITEDDGLENNTLYEYKTVAINETEERKIEVTGARTYFITQDLENVTETGDGTKENPYCIVNITGLQSIINEPGAYYKLCEDIDAKETEFWDEGRGFLPIGDDTVKFHGNFDGNGHNITNLHINRPYLSNTALFGHIGFEESRDEDTRIENVNLRNVTIEGDRGVGALVGRTTGSENTIIQNSSVYNGSVSGSGAVGGLVGSHNSFRETPGGRDNPEIRRSFANVTVNDISENGGDKFGGLVGFSQKGNVIDSYALGNVYAENAERVGGLAGCVDWRGEIRNSYSTGYVEGGEKVGGLVGNTEGQGQNAGRVIDSYWDTETSEKEDSAGGEGLTTDEMIGTEAKDNMDGFDFDDIWETVDEDHDNAVEDGYPILQAINRTIQLRAQDVLDENPVTAHQRSLEMNDNLNNLDLYEGTEDEDISIKLIRPLISLEKFLMVRKSNI